MTLRTMDAAGMPIARTRTSEKDVTVVSTDDAAYPRPQLVRDDWLCLNGVWRFSFDDKRRFKQPAEIDKWPLSIKVPFPPESKASGIGDRGFHAACWYQ